MGLMVGGPVGAAIGALAGHLVDEKGGEGAAPGAASAPVAEVFFRRTFEVMGHVAKADGHVSAQEINAARAVMARFRLDEAQVAAAIACFTRGKSQDYDLTAAVLSLRRACAGRPELLGIFLEIQMRASIDGTDLGVAARPLLTRIAAMLGVSSLEFAHFEAVLRMRGAGGNGGPASAARMSLSQAYEVLEVTEAASDEQVSKSYRRQLSRHHPDKLKANGLPESMLEHAKQRTQQIIEAYDTIRAARPTVGNNGKTR